jgi:hypothetical protein
MNTALETRTALVIIAGCTLALLVSFLSIRCDRAPVTPIDWRLRDANGQIVTHVYDMRDPCNNPDWKADLEHIALDPNDEAVAR